MILDAASLPSPAEELRQDVQDFLAGEVGSGQIRPHCDSWPGGWDAAFSRRPAERPGAVTCRMQGLPTGRQLPARDIPYLPATSQI